MAEPPTMQAMVLGGQGQSLQLSRVPLPAPEDRQILIRIGACAVCRTDLHVIDAELPDIPYPIIPGHEIVGTVAAVGPLVDTVAAGDRVGVPWLGYTCGKCEHCRQSRENLCDAAKFTGYQIDGGYAEYCVADARFCFQVPDEYTDVQAAPLLCAGLIGYRSLRMTGDARRVGLYGFGAAAHIVAQVAVASKKDVYAFTKPGDDAGQGFARLLGAAWAGGSDESPPAELDAAIIFAPVGALVPTALRAVRKGGIVVCAGIHMTDIPTFPYSALWGERSIKSVANLTRKDGVEFLGLAPRVPVRTETRSYTLERANEALEDVRNGQVRGAAVLVIGEE